VPDYLKPEPRRQRSLAWLVPVGILALAGVLLFATPLSRFNPLLRPKVDDTLAQNNREKNRAGGTEEGPPLDGDTNPTDDNDPADAVPSLDQPDPSSDPSKPATLVNPDVVKPVDADVAATDPPSDSPEPEDSTPPPPPESEASPPPVKKPMPAEPVLGTELGRYISDETVLALYDNKAKEWLRAPPRSLIVAGDRCVSLPVYRPQIAMASGAQITMVGETIATFSRDENEAPQITITYGKLILNSIAMANVKTRLDLNGFKGTLTLESPDSVAAIEVYNYLSPGVDPLTEAGANQISVVANFLGITGNSTWQPDRGEALTITPNSFSTLQTGEVPRKRTRVHLPPWIDSASTPTLEREAAKFVDPLIPGDRSLDLSLQELANHRRIDVRVHVARCLAMLGNYKPIIRHLSEEAYRQYWIPSAAFTDATKVRPDSDVDVLKRQIARGPETAEHVRNDLAEARGERDAKILYRMLLGYSQEQLASGADEQLVEALAYPNMDVRVLAMDNLFRITGALHLYNAAQPPDKMRSRIKAWQDVLGRGAIRYASKPSPLPELKSLDPAEKSTPGGKKAPPAEEKPEEKGEET
jgi:hypothetical protein